MHQTNKFMHLQRWWQHLFDSHFLGQPR